MRSIGRRRLTLTGAVAAAVVALTVFMIARSAGDATGNAENRADAVAEGNRLLDLLPVPPGATRTADSPIPSLRQAYSGASPSDSTLTRTAWWTVPEPVDAVTAWFRTHRPAGLAAPDGWGTAVADDGASVATIAWTDAATAAYSTPHLIAEWTAMPGGTAIRADVTIAARSPRPTATRIPHDVTDVTITRSITPTTGDNPPTRTVRRRLSDPVEAAQVVDAINTAPEVPHTDSLSTGHGSDENRLYRIRITWPGHTMLAELQASADDSLSLTLDGQPLDPQLEMGYRFAPLLDGLLQDPGARP